MEAWSGRSKTRLIVVDFLATLFVTFCIGVATAIVLAACVMLMAGDAHGAPPAKAPASAARASAADLILAHYFASKYSGLVAVNRAQPPDEERQRVTASRR
jgi:MFS superfamily sulfate permease-like transporter